MICGILLYVEKRFPTQKNIDKELDIISSSKLGNMRIIGFPLLVKASLDGDMKRGFIFV